MTSFVPECVATAIGSLPHRDPERAVSLVQEFFPEIPCWPQLPRRDFRENMYAQFSEGVPAIRIDTATERIGALVGEDLTTEIEGFYDRYLKEEPDVFALGRDHAAGLYAFMASHQGLPNARLIKGQLTGPISLGLRVCDQNMRPILYNDMLHDVLVKATVRQAQWQERLLSQFGETLIFVDEPSLSLFGASMVALNRDQVIQDLEEVYSSLQGRVGTHCCGNTDWSLLLETSVDVISFDAYSYAENMALYAAEVQRYLERGGMLAWGIVPTTEDAIALESPEHLHELLAEGINLLVRKGLDRNLLFARTLITPACGLGTLTEDAAERAMWLTRETSRRVRQALFP